MSKIDSPFRPTFNLGEFRQLVARYVKMMIRARWQHDQGFLKQEELASWKLENIAEDRQPTWRLLAQAASTLGILNREFLPRCGSGGVAETDPTSPVGRLVNEIAFFVSPLGGGPEHNQSLTMLSEELRKGACVDWESVANWKSLQIIRDDLDLLPEVGTDSSQRPPGQSVFRRKGTDFEIAFRDGDPQVYRDLNGFWYMVMLLSSPGKRHTGLELREATNNKQGGRSVVDTRDVPTSGNEGGSKNTIVDMQALKEANERINEIREEIDQAKKINHHAVLSRLESERDEIKDYVRKTTDNKGNPKQVFSDEKNSRDSVRAAIKTALKSIKAKDPDAFEHLDNSLKYDDGIRYSPAVEIDWQIYF